MNYDIYRDGEEIFEYSKLENAIYELSSFEYSVNLLKKKFAKQFDYYFFLDWNNYFQVRNEYEALIQVLNENNDSAFFISCPQFYRMYPLKIFKECPFEIYKKASSYTIDETKGHYMEGVGFSGKLEVFTFSEKGTWAMIHDDPNNIVIVGADNSAKVAFDKYMQQFIIELRDIVSFFEKRHQVFLNDSTKDLFFKNFT